MDAIWELEHGRKKAPADLKEYIDRVVKEIEQHTVQKFVKEFDSMSQKHTFEEWRSSRDCIPSYPWESMLDNPQMPEILTAIVDSQRMNIMFGNEEIIRDRFLDWHLGRRKGQVEIL